jgi:cytochrome c-type biogenesis protein CcmH/NrfF
MRSDERWALSGEGNEGIPKGLKPGFLAGENAKAKALAYLETKTDTESARGETLGCFDAEGFGGRKATGEAKEVGGVKVFRYLLRRWISAAVVCLLAVVMLGADPSSRFNRVGHQMMCACGCGQVLLECNHVGCPDSDRMIGELRGQIAGGGSDTEILNRFAAKYGATILAAPIRGGFDNVAWIAPMAVFLLATVGVGFLIRMWTLRRRVTVIAGPVVGGDALRERIRRETEY